MHTLELIIIAVVLFFILAGIMDALRYWVKCMVRDIKTFSLREELEAFKAVKTGWGWWK